MDLEKLNIFKIMNNFMLNLMFFDSIRKTNSENKASQVNNLVPHYYCVYDVLSKKEIEAFTDNQRFDNDYLLSLCPLHGTKYSRVQRLAAAAIGVNSKKNLKKVLKPGMLVLVPWDENQQKYVYSDNNFKFFKEKTV